MDYVLTPGQVHDCTQAQVLLAGRQGEQVLADKGYDSDAILECIELMGAQAVIPPRSNRTVQRTYDTHLYKARHAIENLFAKLKQYRSLATRYDKTQRNYAAMVAIACVLTWLRL
jgi:transposase